MIRAFLSTVNALQPPMPTAGSSATGHHFVTVQAFNSISEGEQAETMSIVRRHP